MSSVFTNQTLRVEFTVSDELAVIVPLQTATIQMIFKKPNGKKETKTATLTTDGSDGKMEYTTTLTDLNVAGTWLIQGIVTEGAAVYPTNIQTLEVLKRV